MRILVVEDTPVVALEIADQLQAAGHTVIGPATTIRQALELMRADHPEAAVLDIWLGGDTSAAVASTLMAAEIPFIVLSGFSPDVQPLIFRKGRWLLKPHQERELLAEVSSLGLGPRRQQEPLPLRRVNTASPDGDTRR
jgi:DNA-binding response OmpR family regulator